MSAVKSDVPDRSDRTLADSRRDMVDSTKNSSGSERVDAFENTSLCENQRSLPGKCNSIEDLSLIPSLHLAEKSENGIASSPFPEGKVPPHHVCYANGYRIPQVSVRQQQPQVSKTQRVGSTASICSHSSKKSCKSTASQIQEVAGDEVCVTLLLACLFCQFSDIMALLSGSLCSCFLMPSCSSRLLGLCSSPGDCCCCCCCSSEGPALELCYQTDHCAHCALACLFCEFISLCSLALDCMGCGGCLEAACNAEGGESLAKSCCGDGDGAGCPCGFSCGMMQDCCSSSDCLEICLDCCSICFPA